MYHVLKFGFGFFIILVSGYMFSGCDVVERGSDKSEPESGIAKEGLTIYFREYHQEVSSGDAEAEDPELFLVMKTKEIMPCINYAINYQTKDISQNPLIREVSLLGVGLPGSLCLTAIGPATGMVSFDMPPQMIRLSIRENGYSDLFEITLTERYAEIKPLNRSFTEIKYERYYRKPENSFYFSCGTLHSMSELCQDFHTLMMSELAITEFEFPDDGYIPYPESGGNQHNHPSRFYTYELEEEFHEAGELLEQFTEERIGDTEGNSLAIINWREEGYRSWMFQR